MTGPRVVAIGDSITYGVGDGTQRPQGTVGWASHVAHALDAESFVNLAHNGVRAREMCEQQLPQALSLDPHVVLATVGGNDVLRGDFDPQDVTEAVRTTLSALHGRQVVLLLLDHIQLCEYLPRRVAAVMARRIDQANGALRGATAGSNAVLIDGAEVFARAGRLAWHVDRIHPSPSGHRALADQAICALAPHFAQVHQVSPAPAPPHRADTAWWLLRNGAPWIARRSRDLIPQLSAMVTHELLEQRRGRATPA